MSLDVLVVMKIWYISLIPTARVADIGYSSSKKNRMSGRFLVKVARLIPS